MTDFPAQTDPTTAPDSADAQLSDAQPSDAPLADTQPADAQPFESNAADDDPDAHAADTHAADTHASETNQAETNEVDTNAASANATDTYAHVGNGVYQPASGAFNGTADRINERFHEVAGRAGDAISHATDEAGERIAGATQAAVTRIRNNASLPASRGTTTIANEVVEKIAGIAARDVPGVYDLGGDTVRLLSSVREKLHLGDESKAQGIAVKLNGKEAELSITIVLEYGFVVSSVTDRVREKTISAVETLLGLDVTNVDILVDDIHVDTDGPVGDDATRAAGYSSGTQGITVGG
jgi:uncharacterized alkaline shock family protein YloU